MTHPLTPVRLPLVNLRARSLLVVPPLPLAGRVLLRLETEDVVVLRWSEWVRVRGAAILSDARA